MPSPQQPAGPPSDEGAHQSSDGGAPQLTREQIERLEHRYGNRYLLEPAPDGKLPRIGMTADEAAGLIEKEMVLDGIPMRNLATFVTTWMEPEADRIIAENLHTNFIDHAEYPQTAEIEQRCIRMLADLFHAPDKTTGARTQGSSEAIILGALSLKWKWRERREAVNKSTDRPNLVFGGDVHVVWEKFCRYFDVEPRIVPLAPDKYTIGPEDVAPHIDENTIGVAAVLGTTFTGHADDIRGINSHLVTLKHEQGLDVPLHVDAASGGFVWPFLYPDSEWDFRLEQVRSINVSGHKFGLVYPGIGWLVFREESDLAEDLVFYENYLGKRDATFTLNFSTGSAMVLAQYYNFARLGHSGYRYVMETMKYNARTLAREIAAIGEFEIIGASEEEQLPLVAFKLTDGHDYDEFDVAAQLAAERGWMLPAYTLPPNAEHVKIMRALVKQTLSYSMTVTLGKDIAEACATLAKKGGLHPSDRKRVKTNTGF
jgi:glutamate decarboxylase